MDMIKFAIIGQGHIGKRHAEMVRRNPGAGSKAHQQIDNKILLFLRCPFDF